MFDVVEAFVFAIVGCVCCCVCKMCACQSTCFVQSVQWYVCLCLLVSVCFCWLGVIVVCLLLLSLVIMLCVLCTCVCCYLVAFGVVGLSLYLKRYACLLLYVCVGVG